MPYSIKNHRLDGVEYIKSPNKGSTITPKFVVMHYTAGYTAESAIRTFMNKRSKVSAHLVIDRDGSVTQMVPFNTKAWHAGPSSYMGYHGLNSYSIGIEMVNIGWLRPLGNGRYQDPYGNIRTEQDFPEGFVTAPNPRLGSGVFVWPRYPQNQLKAVDEIVEAIVNKYDILDVVSHEEIDTRGWKTDPGPAFPMKLVKRHVKADRNEDFETYMVTANKLNVRGGPGTNFGISKQLSHGTIVHVIERSGDWGRISNDEWVHMNFLVRT